MKKPDMDSYIRQLQRSRGLTLQELSRMLGYSSQTSLTRLMQASANRASLQQFSQRLHACEGLKLTREETNQLDDLIELHDIGDDFATMVALRRLLRGEDIVRQDKLSILMPDGTETSFMAHFGAMKLRRMLLVNSETVALYNELSLLMEQSGVTVEHWLYTRGESIHMVNCLRATMPLLYSPGYKSYTYTFNFDPTTNTRGLMTSDLLLCEYEEPDGRICCELTVFVSPCCGKTVKADLSMEQAMELLPPRRELQPVCMQITEDDMIQYSVFCAELERDRMVCRIKQDLGMEQIPLHILEHAIQDQAPPEVLQELRPLTEIFRQRQMNVLEKTEPQYHIYRLDAMRRFAETGRLSDHLWCCRTFTIEERISILRFIRFTLMEKENFHLHFLKDEAALRCDEIVLYEERGLSIIKPYADYQLNHAHTEILITQPAFLKVFKRFFLESTLRYRVRSREDACREMEVLISLCEAMLE